MALQGVLPPAGRRRVGGIIGVFSACNKPVTLNIKYGGAAEARPCYDFYCLITACP